MKAMYIAMKYDITLKLLQEIYN